MMVRARVGAALRRRHTAVGDQQIRTPEIRVDDAAFGVGGHPTVAEQVDVALDGDHPGGAGGTHDVLPRAAWITCRSFSHWV
jgi:hypothetical protein